MEVLRSTPLGDVRTKAHDAAILVAKAPDKYGFIHTDGTITIGSFVGGAANGGFAQLIGMGESGGLAGDAANGVEPQTRRRNRMNGTSGWRRYSLPSWYRRRSATTAGGSTASR